MLISIAPAGLEKMLFEFGVPLPAGSTSALPQKKDEIEKLLRIAPRYGIEIRVQTITEDRLGVIRQYEDQDLNDLLANWAAASEIAHPFLSQEFLATKRDNIPNLYLPNAETWVYEADGHVVGFVALIGNEVGAVFVHPGHQRMGVGEHVALRRNSSNR